MLTFIFGIAIGQLTMFLVLLFLHASEPQED